MMQLVDNFRLGSDAYRDLSKILFPYLLDNTLQTCVPVVFQAELSH